jgi:hypothetical protein
MVAQEVVKPLVIFHPYEEIVRIDADIICINGITCKYWAAQEAEMRDSIRPIRCPLLPRGGEILLQDPNSYGLYRSAGSHRISEWRRAGGCRPYNRSTYNPTDPAIVDVGVDGGACPLCCPGAPAVD